MGSQTAAIKRLQAAVVYIEGQIGGSTFTGKVGPSTSVASQNGVSPLMLAAPDSSHDSSGFVVKMGDNVWGDSSPYGSGQAFLLLSSSATAASDISGDGIPGSNTNPVLFRVDNDGGIGTTRGIHVAPGLRQGNSGTNPSQGIWVQQFAVDAAGVVLSGPNPTYVPSPTLPFLSVTKWSGTAFLDINSVGALRSFADDGTTAVAATYPGTTPSSGYRNILLAQSATTGVQALKAAASQSAPIQSNLSSTAVLLSGADSAGNLFTKADDGTTNVAVTYTGSTPSSGYRQILVAQSAATSVLGLRGAASQSGNYLAAINSGSTLLTGIDSAGTNFTKADDGTTNVSAIYAGSTPASGYRSILLAQTAATSILGLRGAASQSGNYLAAVNSGGTTMSGINSKASLFTNDDTGTQAAVVEAGTTPASGVRAQFKAVNAGIIPLIAQGAVSSTVDLFRIVAGSGVTLARESSAGHFLQATTTAPTLAEMVDGEWTARVSASTLILYGRVSGVLKSVTLTLA